MNNGLLVVMGLYMIAAPASVAEGPATAELFLTGGDISMVPKFEELDAIYRDDKEPSSAMRIMMNHGCNCFRLRLFVHPTMENAVIQDVPYTVDLARRVKNMGAVLLLDLHYSDTWADPGRQTKPVAWKDLTFQELENKVESYTAEVIATLKEADGLPDIVQIGNEITPGFLWPEGQLAAPEGGWSHFTALLKAGIRGVKQPLSPNDEVKIMIHTATGGNVDTTDGFVRKLEEHQVEYDMVGLSYYPWWHGSIEALRENLRATAMTFGKEIVVVETAYPWRESNESNNMDWPQTPQGQQQFLEDVLDAVYSTPNGLGRGVIWWYPESIPVQGLRVWKRGTCALFDANGEALPALDSFRGAGRTSVDVKSHDVGVATQALEVSDNGRFPEPAADVSHAE